MTVFPNATHPQTRPLVPFDVQNKARLGHPIPCRQYPLEAIEAAFPKHKAPKRDIAKVEKAPKPIAFNLDAQLTKMGQDAVTFLKEGKLTMFDPLVSDRSCQIRVLWLIDAKKRVEQLQEADYKILGLYRLLTITTHEDLDKFGMPLVQTTDPEQRWPKQWEAVSKKKAFEALGTAKKQLSYEMVDYLKRELQLDGLKVGPEWQEQVVTSWSGAPVRYIKFFTGYESILAMAEKREIPIVVLIMEFYRQGDIINLVDSRVLSFQVVHGEYRLVGCQANTKDEPCLTFEMYTARTGQEQRHSLEDTAKMIENLGIQTVVLSIAAAHPQYPSDARVRKTNAQPTHFEDVEEERYAKTAERFDLGRSKYFRNGKYFEGPIALDVKHAFAAMRSEVNERHQRLKALHDTWI